MTNIYGSRKNVVYKSDNNSSDEPVAHAAQRLVEEEYPSTCANSVAAFRNGLQSKVRSRALPFALEQRFVFDGALAV